MNKFIAFPYRLSGMGRTATANEAEHVRQLIEQVLFTMPGERINRPDFGSNLMQMVFAPQSDELATANQFLLQAALQKWLGELIIIEQVDIAFIEEKLSITVQYQLRHNQTRQTETFVQPS